MDLTVNKKINDTTSITIKFDNERDITEAILKATPFLQMSDYCPKCKKAGCTVLQARTTKKKETGEQFIYVEQFCLSCRSKRPLSEYLNPKGALFIKPWEDPYVKPGSAAPLGPQQQTREPDNYPPQQPTQTVDSSDAFPDTQGEVPF